MNIDLWVVLFAFVLVIVVVLASSSRAGVGSAQQSTRVTELQPGWVGDGGGIDPTDCGAGDGGGGGGGE